MVQLFEALRVMVVDQRGQGAFALKIARLRLGERGLDEAHVVAGPALCEARQVDRRDHADARIAAGRRRLGHQHDRNCRSAATASCRHDAFGDQFHRRVQLQLGAFETVADAIRLVAHAEFAGKKRAPR
jgi:hypothetical protein